MATDVQFSWDCLNYSHSDNNKADKTHSALYQAKIGGRVNFMVRGYNDQCRNVDTLTENGARLSFGWQETGWSMYD